MECNFTVGQRVLCISEDTVSSPSGYALLTPIISPVKGKIYTVRSVDIGVIGGKPCLRLDEIEDQDALVLGDGQVWEVSIIWDASDFRPLVTRKTDISQLRALLNTQRVVVGA